MTRGILFLFLISFSLFASDVDSKKEALYKLNLQALIYTKDLKNALKLAKSGIEAFPQKRFWIEEAAKISLWSGESKSAKKYLKALYALQKDEAILAKLQTLCVATHDEELSIELLQEHVKNGHLEAITPLYDAYELGGYLERGADFFQEQYAKHPEQKMLEAKLDLMMDFSDSIMIEEAYLAYEKKYGVNTGLTLKYVKKLLAKKHFDEAFSYLNKLRDKMPMQRHKFWSTYMDLAYVLKREKELYAVLKSRFKQGKCKGDDLFKLRYLAKKIDPSFSENIAKQQYLDYPSISTFYVYISLLQKKSSVDTLHETLENIPKSLQYGLADDPSFWLLRAHDFAYQKQTLNALKAYKKASSLSPDDVQIQLSIIWLLVDQKNKKELKSYLASFPKGKQGSSDLMMAMSSGYALLGDVKNAKRHFDKSLLKEQKSWQKSLFYADLLLSDFDEKRAAHYQRWAWKCAKKEAKKSAFFKEDDTKLFDFVRLAMKYSPLLAKKYLKVAKERLPKSMVGELYLGEAIEANLRVRAGYMAKKYKINHPWLSLYFAQLNKDKKGIKKLLKEEKAKLRSSDLIAAARSVHMGKLAEETLYDALQKEPNNDALKSLLYAMRTQNKPRLSLGYKRINRSKLHFDDFMITSRKSLSQADISLSYQEKEQLSDRTLEAGVAFKDAIFRYAAFVNARERGSLDYGFGGGFGYVGRYISANLSLGFSVLDESSNAMLLKGNKDFVKVTSLYTFSPAHSLSLELHKNRYRMLEKDVGDSFGGIVSYRKQMRFGYPELSARGYVVWEDYEKSRFNDFWQLGVGADLGDQSGRYHRAWRGHVGLDMLYNSNASIGYILRFGSRGALFRHDQLSVDFEYSSGVGKIVEDLYALAFKYDVW